MTADISIFLNGLGLGKYSQVFIDSDIDITLLSKLSESHLKELGMSLGHRLILLDALAALPATPLSQSLPVNEKPEPGSDLFSAQGERRQLSVMFVDLVGSTSLSEQFDPEEFSEIVRSYQIICAEVINQCQATIAKYSGDGILIYFGYPVARENDVERALRAGLQLIESFHTREIRAGLILQVRIGIATGLVVVGETIGENSSEEQVVLGETPNLAARLQSLAKPNEVVVSHRSQQLAGNSFEYTDLGEIAIKGFSTPQHCWRVDTALKKSDRQHSPELVTTPRLLGRKEELGLLVNRWSRTRQGEGQTLLLSGEAGIGKSRLVSAFTELLNKDNGDSAVIQLDHFCSDYHQNTFLHPVIDQCLQITGVQKLETPSAKLESLRQNMDVDQSLPESDLTLLAELLSIPIDGDREPGTLTQQFKQSRTMEVLTNYYIKLACSSPVLMLFEDMHWADPSTIDLIGRIKNSATQLPIMMLLTYRSDFESPWKNHPNVTQLSLSRLPRTVSAKLARDVSPSKKLDDDLLQNIIDRADGIPLFIEELTKTVLGYANDESDTGGSEEVVHAQIPPNEIPESLQDSLLARLDRQASARRIAQIGSAFGREFRFEDIRDLVDIEEQSLAQKFDELVEAELLLRDGGNSADTAYRFKHSLVRDAAYVSMLKSNRRQLHRRIAESLQGKEDILNGSPEIIAEHWERAENYGYAVNYWLNAGERSKKRFALAEATGQLSRIVNIAKKDECQGDGHIAISAARALALTGDIAGLHGDADQANQHYDEALEFAKNDEISLWIHNKKHIPKTTRRANATIAYDVHGSGSETIVLASAMIYGLGTLQPALEELSQDFRVITIHPRGSGNSDPVVRPYPVTEHAEDLAAIIRSASHKPVIAIGLSRAANTIIRMITRHKGLVRKLVTVGCPCKQEFGQGGPADPKKIAQREKAYKERDIDSLVEMLHKRILTEPGTDELRIKSTELRRQLPEDTILSFFDPDPLMNITDVLPDIDIPVQVIHGAEDQQVVLDSPRLLAELLPDSRLHLIEQAGHIPMITATQEFCNLVKRFINEESHETA